MVVANTSSCLVCETTSQNKSFYYDDSKLAISQVRSRVRLSSISLKEKSFEPEDETKLDILAESWQQVNSKQTSIVYDDRMLLHKKYRGTHMERPERLVAIKRKLDVLGLTKSTSLIDARRATFEELNYVHTKRHIRKLMKLSNSQFSDQECHEFALEEYEDIYLNKSSVDAALLAAGCSISAVEAVVKGSSRNSFALVRPPGHHAESHCGMGFCLFNNVAVAAKAAINDLGVQRVLIVDWDVHHGNGTQRCFLEDERVLYFSCHRDDHGTFYPSFDSSSPKAVGTGQGIGKTVNVAWNGKGYGDDDYLAVWKHVLMPIASQFSPELVIVSAGFDAALGDNTGGCKITPDGYAKLISELKTLNDGKLVAILEGGYHVESLSNSVAACVKEMQNESTRDDTFYTPESLKAGAVDAINKTIKAHQPYWTGLKEISI